MIVTPHQDMFSQWQMVQYLGHHNDRKWLHFQWEKELASGGQQGTWLKSFSREIGFPIHGTTPLCLDNEAVIFLMVNPVVKAYWHTTSLYLGTVWEYGHWTFTCARWGQPSRSVHQVLPSCQSGEISGHDWTHVEVWLSGSVETESHEESCEMYSD